jgi:hypothetical protein
LEDWRSVLVRLYVDWSQYCGSALATVEYDMHAGRHGEVGQSPHFALPRFALS